MRDVKYVKIEAMKLKVVIIGVGLVILALVVYYRYIIGPIQPFQSGKSPSSSLSPSPTISKPPGSDEGRFCIQVITPAKNPPTGECKEFPTPCDVPEGWEKVSGCH